jgi:hypothetical protein
VGPLFSFIVSHLSASELNAIKLSSPENFSLESPSTKFQGNVLSRFSAGIQAQTDGHRSPLCVRENSV